MVFLEAFIGFYLVTFGVVPPEVTNRAVVAFAAYGLIVHMLIFIPILCFEKKAWRKYFKATGGKPTKFWAPFLNWSPIQKVRQHPGDTGE
tara:strand:+ start:1216 stop:1485 length:270 start_codon:yes stop_codon:yes gene_type:complete